MAERLELHEFKPYKLNPYRCENCPYLRNNPIHRRQHGQLIRGTAQPNKFG